MDGRKEKDASIGRRGKKEAFLKQASILVYEFCACGVCQFCILDGEKRTILHIPGRSPEEAWIFTGEFLR